MKTDPFLAAALSFLPLAGLFAGLIYLSNLEDPTRNYYEYSYQVVTEHGVGSAVSVKKGSQFFVTAAHVTKGQKTVKLRQGVIEFEATVLREDTEHDVAILGNPTSTYKGLPLSCDTLSIGTEVTVTGYPFGIAYSETRGQVSTNATKIGHWTSAHLSDATAAPGNSGGAVISSSGRVLGILVGAFTGYSYTVVVPGQAICGVLQ